jgi:methyltransferase
LATNNIETEAISILEVPQPGGILFPLLNDPNLKVNMTMCNPPFYASDEEMQKGVDLKVDGPHAVRPALLSYLKLMIGC